MIKDQEQISLLGSPLFTKVSVETPLDDELQLPSEACCVYIVDGDDQVLSKSENIIASPGHVILSLCGLTVGKMISEQNKGSTTSIIVHFSHELLKLVFEDTKPEFWKELETPVTKYVAQSAAGELIGYYFEGINHLFNKKTAATDNILKLKLKEIILLLLQTENSHNIQQIVRSLFSERTFTFRELVDAHIFSGASIEELAILTNCSVSTFKRKFKEIYKSSPAKHIINQKVERVATLLKLSDKTISAIGYECGFNSPEHLSRVFKRKYGVSPSEYRLSQSIK